MGIVNLVVLLIGLALVIAGVLNLLSGSVIWAIILIIVGLVIMGAARTGTVL